MTDIPYMHNTLREQQIQSLVQYRYLSNAASAGSAPRLLSGSLEWQSRAGSI